MSITTSGKDGYRPNNTISKRDIVKIVSAQTGVPRDVVLACIDGFIATVTKGLMDKHRIDIMGFLRLHLKVMRGMNRNVIPSGGIPKGFKCTEQKWYPPHYRVVCDLTPSFKKEIEGMPVIDTEQQTEVIDNTKVETGIDNKE